jgi:HTH-like domain
MDAIANCGDNVAPALPTVIIELARQFGRYGYRKIAELLRAPASWVVNDKRVERIWRREGLKVPVKQHKRDRPQRRIVYPFARRAAQPCLVV